MAFLRSPSANALAPDCFIAFQERFSLNKVLFLSKRDPKAAAVLFATSLWDKFNEVSLRFPERSAFAIM